MIIFSMMLEFKLIFNPYIHLANPTNFYEFDNKFLTITFKL